jgi:aspartate kinase
MKNQVIVGKFGGSSLENAERIDNCARLALKRKMSMVVVSATSGTTNQLLKCIDLCQSQSDLDEKQGHVEIDLILTRHLQIAEDLKLGEKTNKAIKDLVSQLRNIFQGMSLLEECSAKAIDKFISFGERLSSVILTDHLSHLTDTKCIELQAGDILKTDSNFNRAKPDYDRIEKASLDIFKDVDFQKVIYVTQGFTGKNQKSQITTLGRGGSDLSAAIFAWAMDATLLEIWTDVSGVKTLDPRICKKAKNITHLTYSEASELASFGAKVLHPSTLLPAVKKDIPVFVGNSLSPNEGGTKIKGTCENLPMVRAFAVKRDQILLTITTPDMWHTSGFLYNVFGIFHKYQISIDTITTSEISVALTLDDASLLTEDLVSELSKVGKIKLEKNLSIVSLIGNKIFKNPTISSRIFNSIGAMNVRMISYGAGLHNFCFLVDDDFAETAVKRLHEEFIEKVDGNSEENTEEKNEAEATSENQFN